MKKFFVFFLLVLLAIFTVTSCNQLQPSRKISVSLDTTIYQNIPVTNPLYSCNTGSRLPYDKLMAMNSVPVRISLRKDTIISGNMLSPVTNGQKDTTNNSGLEWLWPILGGLFGLFGLLMLIAFLMLAAWAIREFWRMLFGPRPSDQAPANRTEIVAPNQQRVVVPGAPAQPTPPQTRDEVSNHQLTMAESLVTRQNIHKVTQKTKSGADGSWESEIEITTKNEEKKG